jgi:hypothetical protein
MKTPDKPIVCVESAMAYGSAQAFLFTWYVSIKWLTIVQAIGEKFPRFLRFFYILVAGIYVTKTVKKCLQFVYIFAHLLPVKCQAKFLILAVRCWIAINILKNCLLNACTIAWKITPLLPNNCLTTIQTSHRFFEAYCLYNRMEKHTFFAEQLFDKN